MRGELLFVFAALPALFWVTALLSTLKMVRSIRVLGELPAPAGPPPRVTVVSPACNEAEGIEASVTSWLAQEGLALQVVVVDDRSTDDTGRILDALALADARVTVLHNDALPEGWLGKVYALHRGTALATGDWLLFADADVRLASGAVARAVAHAEAEGLALLSVYPQVDAADFLGDVVWSALGATTGLAGLWRSRDPRSSKAFAAGAFILVSRRAFEATEGFAWLRLEVADDQGLALLIKRSGGRCDVVNGRGQVELAWYTSLRDMIDKTQKNWFGIVGRFSLVRCLFIAALLSCVVLSPLAAVVPGAHPATAVIVGLGQLALLGSALLEARWARRRLVPALFAPLGLVLVAWMIARAGWIGRARGGIAWRGVLYPSELLRTVQRFRM